MTLEIYDYMIIFVLIACTPRFWWVVLKDGRYGTVWSTLEAAYGTLRRGHGASHTDNRFNLNELGRAWEENFDDWMPNTLTMTTFEEKLIDDWTSDCFPRHMPVHDWNLPYAEGALLLLRRNIAGIEDEP